MNANDTNANGDDSTETVELPRDSAMALYQWVRDDPAMDQAEPGDDISTALDDLRNAVKPTVPAPQDLMETVSGPDYVCELCEGERGGHNRLSDGTIVCKWHGVQIWKQHLGRVESPVDSSQH